MSNTEMEWLAQALAGNADAFARLVETYQTPVYNLCYRMMGDGGEAEDAAQETFLRAYQNLKRYDRQRSFVTWLLSIAAHYCIDQIRKRRMQSVSLDILPEDALPDGLPGPETSVGQREVQRRMRDLLNTLTPPDRAAVVLRYWYDFSEEEIASSLQLTVSAVKSRLHRSRRELARLYTEQQAAAERVERRKHESPAF